PLPAQPHYDVSSAQRRFWIQDQLSDASKGNTHPASFVIEGALDAAVLRRAFEALVERHEILRTVFTDADGQPRQRILDAAAGGFEMTETAVPDGAAADAFLRDLERRQATARMDLRQGPLFRVQLVRVSAGRHVCVCSMHHTVTDGWSVGVLLNDLVALYD